MVGSVGHNGHFLRFCENVPHWLLLERGCHCPRHFIIHNEGLIDLDDEQHEMKSVYDIACVIIPDLGFWKMDLFLHWHLQLSSQLNAQRQQQDDQPPDHYCL